MFPSVLSTSRWGAVKPDTNVAVADFVNGGADMKAFHDKYTSANGIKFAIGEIGLGQAASMSARVAWLENIMAAQPQMPNMIAVSWFNYYKVSARRDDSEDGITWLTGRALFSGLRLPHCGLRRRLAGEAILCFLSAIAATSTFATALFSPFPFPAHARLPLFTLTSSSPIASRWRSARGLEPPPLPTSHRRTNHRTNSRPP